MISQDHEYYLRRERQERLNAARCDDHGARLIHLELADRYAAMVRQLSPMPQPAQQQMTA